MKKLLLICFSLISCLTIGQVLTTQNNNVNGNALRLVLKKFMAASDDEKINVQWTAANIIDGSYTLEKSKDGINFSAVVDVACTGKGNEDVDYTVADDKPYSSTSYYRLKETEKNSSYAYSDIVVVNFVQKKTIALYPNPLISSGNLNISINGYDSQEVKVMLHDDNGGEFVSKVLMPQESNMVFRLDETKSLLPGTYVVTVFADNKTNYYKLLVK